MKKENNNKSKQNQSTTKKISLNDFKIDGKRLESIKGGALSKRSINGRDGLAQRQDVGH